MPVEFHWLFAAVIPLVLFVSCVVFLWWSEHKFKRQVTLRDTDDDWRWDIVPPPKHVKVRVDWKSLSAYLGVEVRSVEDLKRITRKTQ